MPKPEVRQGCCDALQPVRGTCAASYTAASEIPAINGHLRVAFFMPCLKTGHYNFEQAFASPALPFRDS
jgi:hypothetical protein